MRTPLELRALSDAYYRQQQGTARAAALTVQNLWRQMPTGVPLAVQWSWWAATAPAMADALAEAQFANATRSTEYLALSAAMQNLPTDTLPEVSPLAFVTATEDALDALEAGMSAYSYRTIQGRPESAARFSGLASLVRVATTYSQDSGREATGVGIAATPTLQGYHRMIVGDTCDRCMILAGKHYKWSNGFDRHDNCDCVHIPAAEYFDDGSQRFDVERVHGLSNKQRDAIRDGADPSQVVNAKRGMSTARIYGRDVQVTSAGTTKRGLAGARLSADGFEKRGGRYKVTKKARLTPAEIYRQTDGDRDHARRLLTKYGYII